MYQNRLAISPTCAIFITFTTTFPESVAGFKGVAVERRKRTEYKRGGREGKEGKMGINGRV